MESKNCHNLAISEQKENRRIVSANVFFSYFLIVNLSVKAFKHRLKILAIGRIGSAEIELIFASLEHGNASNIYSKSAYEKSVASSAQSIGFHALYYFEVEILEMIESKLVDLVFD